MASNHFNAHFVELYDKKGERKGIQQNNNDCQNTQTHKLMSTKSIRNTNFMFYTKSDCRDLSQWILVWWEWAACDQISNAVFNIIIGDQNSFYKYENHANGLVLTSGTP